MSDDRELRAVAIMRRCVQQCREIGIRIPDVELRFDLRGTGAGLSCCRPGEAPVIRLNPVLMAENDDFIDQTVPHEVAHVGVFYWLGRPARHPHGSEWRRLMQLLGAEPSSRHRYDVSNAVTRRLRRYRYACACREHRLTSIRHNRVRRGTAYRCRQCGQALRALPDSRDDE